MTAPVHLVENYIRTSDPDCRAEVVSYCGTWEECSGSGRYTMNGSLGLATCAECIRKVTARLEREGRS